MEKTAPSLYGAYPPYPDRFVPPLHQQPIPQHTVTTVILETRVNYGPESQSVLCPHCRYQIRTQVEAASNSRTHLYALLLCLSGCWPCVCIPYLVDSCQNRNHYCPNCRAFLGVYKG